jgi:hypothetical protein
MYLATLALDRAWEIHGMKDTAQNLVEGQGLNLLPIFVMYIVAIKVMDRTLGEHSIVCHLSALYAFRTRPSSTYTQVQSFEVLEF